MMRKGGGEEILRSLVNGLHAVPKYLSRTSYVSENKVSAQGYTIKHNDSSELCVRFD